MASWTRKKSRRRIGVPSGPLPEILRGMLSQRSVPAQLRSVPRRLSLFSLQFSADVQHHA